MPPEEEKFGEIYNKASSDFYYLNKRFDLNIVSLNMPKPKYMHWLWLRQFNYT